MKKLSENEENFLKKKEHWHKRNFKIFVTGVFVCGSIFIFMSFFSAFSTFSIYSLKQAQFMHGVLWGFVVFFAVRERLTERKFLKILEKLNFKRRRKPAG